MQKSTRINTSSGDSRYPTAQGHGNHHHQESNIDLILKTEPGAPGFFPLTPLPAA